MCVGVCGCVSVGVFSTHSYMCLGYISLSGYPLYLHVGVGRLVRVGMCSGLCGCVSVGVFSTHSSTSLGYISLSGYHCNYMWLWVCVWV